MAADDLDPKPAAAHGATPKTEARDGGESLSSLFAATLDPASPASGRPTGRAHGRGAPAARGTLWTMLTRLKTALLGIAVATAALVPLYGDPRSTPVTHPLWARMLLEALGMMEDLESVGMGEQASQVFSTLSWRHSLAHRADRYLKSHGVLVYEEGGLPRVTATEGVGEVVYPLPVVRGGDYRWRVRIAGDPGAPAIIEVAYPGRTAIKSFAVSPSALAGWVYGGTTHLDPGVYNAAVLLPAGASLEILEVAPPCLNAIEPVGGWKPSAVTRTDDVAVTALKALDLETELPPADLPIERTGRDFHLEPPLPVAVTKASAPLEAGLEDLWLRAGPKGLRGVVQLDVPEPGLYTVSAFGLPGGGQSWLADGCRKAVICPARELRDGPNWRAVMTLQLNAGRHSFAVTLADGAAIERLRLERKKDSRADYLATIRRLGFDPGPDGPVTRDKALAAMGFVRERRREIQSSLCGDLEGLRGLPPEAGLPPTQVAGTGTTAAGGTSSAALAPTTAPAAPPLPPLSPPEPASPTTLSEG